MTHHLATLPLPADTTSTRERPRSHRCVYGPMVTATPAWLGLGAPARPTDGRAWRRG